VSYPLFAILALAVIVEFHGIAVWGVVAFLRTRPLTELQRWASIGDPAPGGAAGRVSNFRVARVLGLALTSLRCSLSPLPLHSLHPSLSLDS